jgi:hypothetical protein
VEAAVRAARAPAGSSRSARWTAAAAGRTRRTGRARGRARTQRTARTCAGRTRGRLAPGTAAPRTCGAAQSAAQETGGERRAIRRPCAAARQRHGRPAPCSPQPRAGPGPTTRRAPARLARTTPPATTCPAPPATAAGAPPPRPRGYRRTWGPRAVGQRRDARHVLPCTASSRPPLPRPLAEQLLSLRCRWRVVVGDGGWWWVVVAGGGGGWCGSRHDHPQRTSKPTACLGA